MKERLEDIKTATVNKCECETCYCDSFSLQWIGVEPEHYDWLIEQAERVQELEELIDTHAPHGRNYTNEQYVDLLQQNKRYREVLEFIVNIDGHFMDKPFDMARALNLIDGGARQALESESDE